MPNWVTNKVHAPSHVIRAMLNTEGKVDFRNLAPFEGPNNWDVIFMDAEMAAEIACGIPVHIHPLIGSLQASNRECCDVRKMSEESFRQMLGMLENYRACGYLHDMAFAREVWGTKWNACQSTESPDDGHCEFETAWSCPIGVLEMLSERFPDDDIAVTYADEDIGSNCGTFTLKAGKVVTKDIAPTWSEMDDAGRSRWTSFAYQVKGIEPREEEGPE